MRTCSRLDQTATRRRGQIGWRSDGQITFDYRKCVKSSGPKYSTSVLPKYMFVYPHSALTQRGASRSSRNVEGGMRWTAGWSARLPRGRSHPGGRRSRVVLVPRRWDQPPGQEPGATEANKPGTPGSARISRKTIAQGMPDVPAGPVVTAACFPCCRRAMGAACTRHSLRPLNFEGVL